MADSFQGVEDIILQPASDAVPYTFTFSIATSATANDGAIPYGDTISSVVVKAYDETGTANTEIINGTPSTTTTVVTVDLDYPTTAGEGRYSLEFVLTLASTVVMEFDFTRIYAEDIAA